MISRGDSKPLCNFLPFWKRFGVDLGEQAAARSYKGLNRIKMGKRRDCGGCGEDPEEKVDPM
ncbi:hypothetical protein Taro_007035, partial [Colocasia esculenta]|nr:hypothetical protein [Colocasia esculenta]